MAFAGRRIEIGQANNVFVFPGVGLGAMVAGASVIEDRSFLIAARELAAAVPADRLAAGMLFPPIGALREVSRRIARAVAGPAHAAEVDQAMWWPAYVPYTPGRTVERRRITES